MSDILPIHVETSYHRQISVSAFGNEDSMVTTHRNLIICFIFVPDCDSDTILSSCVPKGLGVEKLAEDYPEREEGTEGWDKQMDYAKTQTFKLAYERRQSGNHVDDPAAGKVPHVEQYERSGFKNDREPPRYQEQIVNESQGEKKYCFRVFPEQRLGFGSGSMQRH
ncbi:hypothetical protein BYT27DRAFT_7237328 [Phlegmacium glaucopus]|nr:hypothetical protein BYT27DRAFT_7237328 [Phlegmacium glaucopus]